MRNEWSRRKSFFFFFYCAISLIISAYVSEFLKHKGLIPWFISFFGISCFCSRQLFLKGPARKEILFSSLFSLAFGEAVMIGSTVQYSGMRVGMDVNTLSLSLNTLAAGAALAFLLVPAVIVLSRKANKISFPERADKTKRVFFVSWGLIFLGWIPWLLAWYPGGIVGDGAIVLEEAVRNTVPSSNHFVVSYILFIRLFVNLGRAILADQVEGIQLGVFLYALFASAMISCTLAQVLSFLHHRGMPSWMVWIFIGGFALTGFFASHASSLWKDATFSMGVVWLSLLIWKISENGKPNRSQVIAFLLIALFLCFWRNNGVWLIILTGAGTVLTLGFRNTRKLLIVILAVTVFFFVITNPVYRALGIENDAISQSVAVPLQQIAACVNSGVRLNEAQEKTIYEILSPQDWAKYAPTLNDDLKNSLKPYFGKQVGDMIAVWFQLLIPNLKTYVKAYLMLTLGFWQPFCWQGNYFDYWLGIQDLFNRGYHRENLLGGLGSNVLNTMVDSGSVWFISSGTMVWLMILSIVLILMQKEHRRKKLAPLLPVFASWAFIMIATPIAYAYRYIVMIPMMLPVIVFLPLYHNRSGNKENAAG